MTARLPAASDASDGPMLFRRSSAWVGRTGFIRVTLATAVPSSLGSLALTRLIVRVMLGHASMGNAFWISLLVPLPFALLVGGLCLFLATSLEHAWGTVNELALHVTASMGAAGTTPGRILSLDALIQRADGALYQAKSTGRDRVAMSETKPALADDGALPAVCGRDTDRRGPWFQPRHAPSSNHWVDAPATAMPR